MPSYSGPSPDADDTTKKVDPDHLAPETALLSSPAESREAANRLHDDLELLRAERVVSNQERDSSRPRSRKRSHDTRVEDAFNTTTTPATSTAVVPLKTTWLTKLWLSLKKFPRVLRYVVYAIPPGIMILIPVFLDLFAYDSKGDPVGGRGGVQLLWFGIWLEVVWLTLWAARIVTSIMPYIVAFVADTVGSANHKKWKDIGRQLEFPTALFLWLLAVLVSCRPILDDHRVLNDPNQDDKTPYIVWIDVVYKIIIALFVLATLNLIEKILIKWIATSFHLRTYSHRIRENQMQIECLVTLYSYAKTRLEAQDPVWESPSSRRGSAGSPSPLKSFQNNARQVWSKVGSAAHRMAGDFTGRKLLKGNHPRKVVLELLRNTESSYTLARVFYRTFVQPGKSTITVEDLYPAFPTQEDAETCFSVFDKDLNGDISMEELEMVCNEIHLEKKAIAASLKDLDSVIKKLDEVFMFIIVVIVIIVFISIISNSAAAALTSTGTFILGLSWLLQATAQEFLQVSSVLPLSVVHMLIQIVHHLRLRQTPLRRRRPGHHLRQHRLHDERRRLLRPRSLSPLHRVQKDGRPRRPSPQLGPQHALHPQPTPQPGARGPHQPQTPLRHHRSPNRRAQIPHAVLLPAKQARLRAENHFRGADHRRGQQHHHEHHLLPQEQLPERAAPPEPAQQVRRRAHAPDARHGPRDAPPCPAWRDAGYAALLDAGPAAACLSAECYSGE
jgi:ABC-type nickel/cobalt efflux system permease component RcnA